jgi:hypothetical protein
VLAEDRLQEHQHPLVDRVDQHHGLTLAPFLQRLPDPRRRAFLAALVDDGSEGRVDVVALAPLARQAVKASRKGMRAGIEVERAELGGELLEHGGGVSQ